MKNHIIALSATYVYESAIASEAAVGIQKIEAAVGIHKIIHIINRSIKVLNNKTFSK